jgi:hypothetical protein
VALSCRKYASSKVNNQALTEDTQRERARSWGRIEPNSSKRVGICTERRTRDLNIDQEAVHPTTSIQDTEESTTSKVFLPPWGDLYNKIHQEYFPNFTPHSVPGVRDLDDQVFPNIRWSSLHKVACRTPIFPCIETLGWIIDHTDTDKCVINSVEGECIGVFLPVEVKKYYKLRDPEKRLNIDFVVKFYEQHNTNQLLASWWREDKKLLNRTNGWYNTTNLREPYMYLMALIFRLYGEKDCSRFSEAWMPLAYTVAVSGSSFNWGGIISKKLSITIQQAQETKEGETPSFFMASFLLDVICARNVFSGMNLSWHVLSYRYMSILASYGKTSIRNFMP